MNNPYSRYYISILLVLSFSCLCFPALIENAPIMVVQPDGRKLDLFASGDEFFNRIHDIEGYTIMIDPVDGFYVYAGKEDGRLVPTRYIAGESDPGQLGIEKNLTISREEYLERKEMLRSRTIVKAPNIGTLNNVVIFIRFADDPEFQKDISYYDNILNPGSDISMYSYYIEASYNNISIISHFYPESSTQSVVSYQDSHIRNYYRPYNASTNPDGYSNFNQRREREHTLLKNAVEAVESDIPSGLDIDYDDDGYVDNVCFIVKGGVDGWNELLWPHMWYLYSWDVRIHGKRVYTYNFNIESYTTESGVVSHEMFHSLGAPDLYHYNGDGYNPVGIWDIMASNTSPPQHMGAFMKYRYGNWIDNIPKITSSGTYTINSLLEPGNNVYRIDTPGSDTEHFLVEFRRKLGFFENSLPGTGLIVYRINTSADGQGNGDGPPDEIYVFRPNGSTTSNGNINLAFFHDSAGRTEINDTTNPYSFFSDGSKGGLNISDIHQDGDIMSFYVTLDGGDEPPEAPSNLTASAVSAFQINLSWTDNSDNEQGFKIERKTGAGGTWSEIASTGVNTASYENTGLVAETTYFYRIRAYNTAGNSAYSNEAQAATLPGETGIVPVYRFFNTSRGGHLYTVSEAEKNYIMENLPQWNYEGIKFSVFELHAENTTPVYRFFNTKTGIHLYTISAVERDAVLQLPDWTYEGVKFYVYP